MAIAIDIKGVTRMFGPVAGLALGATRITGSPSTRNPGPSENVRRRPLRSSSSTRPPAHDVTAPQKPSSATSITVSRSAGTRASSRRCRSRHPAASTSVPYRSSMPPPEGAILPVGAAPSAA